MEMNAPWITCRMGKKLFLLAKDEKAYYLIEVGKNLDYATEEWLEQQGVSEELLKELQLPFIYIPKSNLRGVAITGNEAGEYIYLYLKSEKKKVMLELDYEPKWIEDFFTGIDRFTPPAEKPAKKKKDKSWRREKRDPELYNKLQLTPIWIGVLSIVVNTGYLLSLNALWFTLWLVVLAIPVVLVIWMPGYFTLIPVKRGEKQDAWELSIPMLLHFCVIGLTDRRNWLDEGLLWSVMGICALASGLVILLAEEFRRQKLAILAVMFFGGTFGLSAVSHANEIYPHEQPQSYVLEVEDAYKSGGRSTSYYCTVTLPDGREVTLHISRSLYEDLEVGDLVRVEHGVGFFGIEYANAYPAE